MFLLDSTMTTFVSGLQYSNIYISMIFMTFMIYFPSVVLFCPFSLLLLLHICDKYICN